MAYASALNRETHTEAIDKTATKIYELEMNTLESEPCAAIRN